ncbi:MAG: hypothetical protein ABSC23_17060 [Bryobacteraceae bacterium]
MRGPTSDDIRRAFASGEFAKARNLWNGYGERLRDAILNRSATAADLKEARCLVDWARLVVKCCQAHSHDRLARARAKVAYAGGVKAEPRIRASL